MSKSIIILLLMLVFCRSCVAAESVSEEAEQLMYDKLSTDKVNQFIASVNQESGRNNLPELTFDRIKELAVFGVKADFKQLSELTIGVIIKSFTSELHMLGMLIFLAMLCTLLQNLQTTTVLAETGRAAYIVCLVFLLIIAVQIFGQGMALVKETVRQMSDFMEAVLPILFSIMLAMGSMTKSALLSPLMLGVVTLVGLLIRQLVLPLMFASTVLAGVNYITGNNSLRGISNLLRQGSIVSMGFFMMLFIGLVTVQGAAGGMADGMALRTAKFAAANFVPIAGRIFSDTVEVVGTAGSLIKNSIGLFGVIIISTLCFMPVIKVFVLGIMMKLTGACIEPLGDSRLAVCLAELGNNLLLLGGMLLGVAVMFFLMLGMLAGTLGMAMR